MNTIIMAEPPIVARRPRTATENNLLVRTRTQASWIWTVEGLTGADSPPNEQRAFRRIYNYPPTRGKPKSATIMVAADDFAAMYVNGVLVSPANPNLDWTVIVGYEVPLPIVQGDNSTSLLLAFRVINRTGQAGLLAGVQINYDDAAPPEVFYTGGDQTWLGERHFQEHWEHPIFDSSQALSTWRPATIFTEQTRSASRPGAVGDEVVVLGQLPPMVVPQTSNPDGVGIVHQTCVSKTGGVAISTGAFVGTILGTAIFALLVGFIGSYFWGKKRKQSRNSVEYEGIAMPQTLPGRQGPPYIE